jgi:WD40 repeat protein
VNDGETKTIAPTTIDKQSAHRSQLNTLLYDKLDPMPPELIDIILDYECYEFKGKLAKTLTDHKGLVCSLIQLNDGRIASGSYDNTIKIWDPEFCKCVKTIVGNTNTFFNIIQLTNNHIAFYSNDSIKAWDPSTNECVRTLIKSPSTGKLLIQLSDGRIASDSYTNFIEIESAENSLSRQTLIGHAGWVQCLIQLINGRYKDHIASGSWDHTIKIWNTRTGACVATLKGHTDMVSCLIQLTNNLIASGSGDGTIKIWDLTTNSCIHTLNNSTGIRCLIQLTDGRLASGSDYTITIWDLTTNSCVNTLTGHMNGVFCLTQLADGRLVSGLQDGIIKIWK